MFTVKTRELADSTDPLIVECDEGFQAVACGVARTATGNVDADVGYCLVIDMPPADGRYECYFRRDEQGSWDDSVYGSCSCLKMGPR